MQEIEDNSNKKLSQLIDELKWEPGIGDLVREKHGPKTMGIITEIHEKELTVHWQVPTQNNVSGTNYEVLHRRYLLLIKKHQSSSSE
jgi:hypothetical protein